MDTKLNGHFFYKERSAHAEKTHTEKKVHVTMEWEIGMMQLQAKAC